MKSKHSHDDYLYCADHTAKLVQEQWVDTVNHDGKWIEEEEEDDSNNALAISFYPRAEPVEPLEWKTPENRLKPSSVEPPELEIKGTNALRIMHSPVNVSKMHYGNIPEPYQTDSM
ncbi:hypothetical protein Tco_0895825 [Tanacetum coccineum]|uniref:Uncharacterized protein n=1 Tax=Tanacetum coccineum TaxID=301880 RepID=A0ABQ5CIW9_9ASTR